MKKTKNLFQKGRPDLLEIANKKSIIFVFSEKQNLINIAFRSAHPYAEIEAVFETASKTLERADSILMREKNRNIGIAHKMLGNATEQ